MRYQEALPKFWVVSRADSSPTIGDGHWRMLAATLEKLHQQIHFPLRCLFMWGAYFCMGAYIHDVVVVIQMGAYIHGLLIFYRCLFYGISGTRNCMGCQNCKNALKATIHFLSFGGRLQEDQEDTMTFQARR